MTGLGKVRNTEGPRNQAVDTGADPPLLTAAPPTDSPPDHTLPPWPQAAPTLASERQLRVEHDMRHAGYAPDCRRAGSQLEGPADQLREMLPESSSSGSDLTLHLKKKTREQNHFQSLNIWSASDTRSPGLLIKNITGQSVMGTESLKAAKEKTLGLEKF